MSSELNISILDWMNYDPMVGTDQLHMVGYPRSGKSNMSTGLFAQCIAKKNELLIMPGDRFCEWRHFPFHPLLEKKDITVIIPPEKKTELFFQGFKRNGWFVETNYKDINIWDYLSEEAPILIIYDNHLGLINGERAGLWVNVFEQALNRRIFLEEAVGFLFHEAGILFPQSARGEQWHMVQEFSELFVESGKGLIRTILVSQLLSEIESTVRNKCLYNIFRKSYVSSSASFPDKLRKALPYTDIDQYHICLGRGIYKRYNEVDYFYENREKWKMIPPASINKRGTESSSSSGNKKTELRCSVCGYEWTGRVKAPRKCPDCQSFDWKTAEKKIKA